MNEEYELNSYARYDEDRGDYMVYEVKYANGYKEYVSRNVFRHLKTLKIIKEKNVCFSVLKDSNSIEEYNDIICYHRVSSMSFEKPIPLIQEEFDLLKEEVKFNE